MERINVEVALDQEVMVKPHGRAAVVDSFGKVGEDG